MANEVHGLFDLLRGSPLLGLELDTTYRVLALTTEAPDLVDGQDSRVQVLLYPVNVIIGSLRRRDAAGAAVERFETEHLLAIAGAFDAAPLQSVVVDGAAPARGEWGPQFSMEGRAQTPDGRTHALTFAVAGEHESTTRTLDLHVTFDHVRVRDALGNDMVVAGIAAPPDDAPLNMLA